MSSTTKTPNIGLNQWQGNEYPKRQDFVDDNVKIDTEIGNLKKIAHGAVADLAALKAIDTTNLTDNITIIVKSLGFYRFDSTSTLTSDDNAVVQPTTGPGRWINDLLSHKADYATDIGVANAYKITLAPTPTSYEIGKIYKFKALNTNTGVSTFQIGTLTAVKIKKNVLTDLASGDISANQIVAVVYDGTNFQLMSPLGYIPLNKAGGTMTGALTISATTPEINFLESDTGKKYILVFDGSGFRFQEDNYGGTNIFSGASGGKFYSAHNTLDDGAGNASFIGTVTAQGHNLLQSISGGYKIQSGTVSTAGSSGGYVSTRVTFPVAFSSGTPLVILTPIGPSNGINSSTYEDFSVASADTAGFNFASNQWNVISYNWIAIGN